MWIQQRYPWITSTVVRSRCCGLPRPSIVTSWTATTLWSCAVHCFSKFMPWTEPRVPRSLLFFRVAGYHRKWKKDEEERFPFRFILVVSFNWPSFEEIALFLVLLLFFVLLLFKLLFKIVRLLEDCRVERRFFKQYESVVYVDFFDDLNLNWA